MGVSCNCSLYPQLSTSKLLKLSHQGNEQSVLRPCPPDGTVPGVSVVVVDSAGTMYRLRLPHPSEMEAAAGRRGVESVLTGATAGQGLTLVHFSAQLEPCLTQEYTLHTPNTPWHPLNTGYTTPTRTPYPIQSAQVELKSGRV